MFKRLERINTGKDSTTSVCNDEKIKKVEKKECPVLDEKETVEGQTIYHDGSQILFNSKLHIDADGSPHAYHPKVGKGLDRLSNAGDGEKWWGIATKNNKPCVQAKNDPAPGFYVSTTALVDTTIANKCNPNRYVNSEEISYIVVPKSFSKKYGVSLGDYAVVYNEKTQKHAFAIIADFGPKGKIGEGSILLANKLGLSNVSPKSGGQSDGVRYMLFPNSKKSPEFPSGANSEREKSIQETGAELLKQAGGIKRISECEIIKDEP